MSHYVLSRHRRGWEPSFSTRNLAYVCRLYINDCATRNDVTLVLWLSECRTVVDFCDRAYSIVIEIISAKLEIGVTDSLQSTEPRESRRYLA